MKSKEEIWKDIPNYEGLYQVSNLGRVKSLGNHKTNKYKILKRCLDVHGYPKYSLTINKKTVSFRAHQLVAMAFLGHKPCGYKVVVDHINNNKTDNRPENLQLISQRENSSKDRKGCTSKYTGVHWDKNCGKWVSQIKISGKIVHLGVFKNEIDAHNAYQDKLKEVNSGKIQNKKL